LRGLPFRATDDEIYEFLEGYGVRLGSLKFKLDDTGRKSGWAAVLCGKKSEALRAVAEKDKKMMGNRYIELNEILVDEYEIFDKLDR
jgi:hypothetical protein